MKIDDNFSFSVRINSTYNNFIRTSFKALFRKWQFWELFFNLWNL